MIEDDVLSFASKLKAEISKNRPKSLSEKQAVIAGAFCVGSDDNSLPSCSVKLTQQSVQFMTSLLAGENFLHLVKGTRITVLPESYERLGELLKVVFTPNAAEILSQDMKFTAAFLKGVFLARGYCSDPEKEYRIELHSKNDVITNVILTMLNSRGIEPSLLKRSEYTMIYFKNGDYVSDFLGIIGAGNSRLLFENIRAERELNSAVTRTVNCDEANSKRQAKASAERTALLIKLMNSEKFKDVPAELRDALIAQINNPGASIQELGNMMDPPIGKSGMNHRLSRLVQIAKTLD